MDYLTIEMSVQAVCHETTALSEAQTRRITEVRIRAVAGEPNKVEQDCQFRDRCTAAGQSDRLAPTVTVSPLYGEGDSLPADVKGAAATFQKSAWH